MTEEEKHRLQERNIISNLACRLNLTLDVRRLYEYSAYIRGVRDGLVRGVERFAKFRGEDAVYDKAEYELAVSSLRNCDMWLMGNYEIRCRNHVKDKKGKVVSCDAYFVKRVVQEVEVK